MKKKLALLAMLIALVTCLGNVRIFAASSRVDDGADLFTSAEIDQLEEQAQRISETYDTDVWIKTSNQYKYSDNFARDMLEDEGEIYHPDGYIAYGINMADRSYWVDAFGTFERGIFTQDKTDGLADRASDELKDGNYFESAKAVLDGIEIRLMIKTDPMGMWKKPLIYWKRTVVLIVGSIVISALIAWLMTFAKVRKHTDKKLARQADSYSDPLNLTQSHDQFVRAYQTRVKVETESYGGGGGGGGGSAGHTGSGGHF